MDTKRVYSDLVICQRDDLLEMAKVLIDDARELESSKPLPEFISLSKVAKLFDIADSTAWRWGEEGIIQIYRIGGVKRVKTSDVKILVEKMKEVKP